MNRLVSAARYLALAGVVFAIVAGAVGFGWAGVKTASIVARLVRGDLAGMAVRLVQVMDGVLIGAGLLIVALGLYELFVGALSVPEWLVVRDLDALKGKLAGIIVLVMAVAFVEELEAAGDALQLLESGAAVALVSAVLVWMAKKG